MSRRHIAIICLCLVIISGLTPITSVAIQDPDPSKNDPYIETDNINQLSISKNSDNKQFTHSDTSNNSQKKIPSYVPNSPENNKQSSASNTVSPDTTDTGSQPITTNKKIGKNDSLNNLTVIYNGSAQWTENSTSFNQTNSPDNHSAEATTQYSQQPTLPDDTTLQSNLNNGIIGDDDRVSVRSAYEITSYPWSSVVTLQLAFPDGTRSQCSGAIINGSSSQPAGHVLTAGHCVYSDERGGWVNTTGESSSYVVPGADGAQEPFGRVGIQNIRSYSGWITDRNPSYDIALITLDERVGEETGALGYVGIDRMSDEVYTHSPTRVTGYPGDKQPRTMWTSTGDGKGTYDFAASESTPEDIVHRYTVDTRAGMSGGPVWAEEYPTYDEQQIISIHAYAVDADLDGETEYTQGTRLTETRFNDIQSWTASDSIPDLANDRFEPNDDFITATTVSANTTLNNLQIVTNDVDMFATELSSGQRFNVTSVFDHTQGDLDMILYNPNRERVASSQSTTDREQIEHAAADNGTYYVAVYGHDDASASYSLSFHASESTDVSNGSPSVPAGWMLSDEQYFAIYEDGEQPNTQAVSSKLNEWYLSESNSISNTKFSTQEISTALNYWFRTDSSETNSAVPAEWQLSKSQYFAFYEDGERPNTQEASAKINQWFSSESNSINDVRFNSQEISYALNYWFDSA